MKILIAKYEPKKRALILATFGFASLAFVLTINLYRQELFGIVPGYAPHNFSFNWLFFIPANIVILIMGISAFKMTLKNWNKWSRKRNQIFVVLLTTPIFGLWVFQITRILIINGG